MTDKQDLIREIHEYVTTHGGENTATHLLVQAASAIQTQAAELEAVGAGGVQALSAAPANHNASRALQGLDFIMRVYEPCMGKPAPDEEMATIVEATKRLLLGWWGEHRDTVRAMLAASPTPPAEQQAQPDECFPGEPKVAVPQGLIGAACFAIRNKRDGGKVLEQLRRYSVGDRSQPLTPQQAAPKAAPGVGNSGFDHQTAADFLSGKTISDEAVRKFVATSRWAHDERAALSATLLAMRGVLTSREAEIALLKKALLEAETATQQEAQEPALFVSAKQLASLADPSHATAGSYFPVRKTRAGLFTMALYTAPQPAPAPLSEMPYEKRKAIQEGEQIGASDAWFKARHEMLDTVDRRNVFRAGFDRGWSAALAAQGGKDA